MTDLEKTLLRLTNMCNVVNITKTDLGNYRIYAVYKHDTFDNIPIHGEGMCVSDATEQAADKLQVALKERAAAVESQVATLQEMKKELHNDANRMNLP